MRVSLARIAALPLALALAATTLTGCSNDDVVGPGGATLVGTWNATSLSALGSDFIADGMDLNLTLSSGGAYTFIVTNDLVEFCDPGPNCTNNGSYTSTASQLTLDAGTADEANFTYSIQGNTMSWNGDIGGTPVTASFTRQ